MPMAPNTVELQLKYTNHPEVIEVNSQVGVGSEFTVWLPLPGFETKDV